MNPVTIKTDFSNYQDPQSIDFRSLFAIIGSKVNSSGLNFVHKKFNVSESGTHSASGTCSYNSLKTTQSEANQNKYYPSDRRIHRPLIFRRQISP
jgi:hypothetical protein